MSNPAENMKSQVLKHKTKAPCNSAEVHDANTIESKSCNGGELVVACDVSRALHLTFRADYHLPVPCQFGTSSNGRRLQDVASYSMQMCEKSVVSFSGLCSCFFTNSMVELSGVNIRGLRKGAESAAQILQTWTLNLLQDTHRAKRNETKTYCRGSSLQILYQAKT